MKKLLFCSLLVTSALPFEGFADSSNLYIGGGIGLYDAKFKDGEIGFVEDDDSATQKKDFSGSGWGGSLFVGKLFEGSKVDWFVQGGISFDTLTHSYEFNPHQLAPTAITSTGLKTIIRRKGTLDLTTGVSKSFNYGLRTSLHLSVLLSRFNVKFTETPDNEAGRLERTEYAWGIAPGISVEKTVGPVSLGLSYSYQMFEDLKSKASNRGNNTLQCSLKQTPIYQVVMLNIKKTF